MDSKQNATFELKQPVKLKPQSKFLNNLAAMRQAALKKKAERWGFDFEAETPIEQVHSREITTKTIPEAHETHD